MKTEDAIKEFGSGRKLAFALNIDPSAVYKWTEEVPRLREYQIVELLAAKNKGF